MSINSIDIHNDRVNLTVHLDDEEPILFFEVPRESDGSENWARVQTWLDDGNEISDRLDYSNYYSDMRRAEYAELNQDEMRYDDLKNSTNTWELAIDAIKVKYPKPS
jgi:hypothetical protein